MMGLLGNVAEVKSLRHRLMTTEFINVFSTLLESCSDGIEVRGVLHSSESDYTSVFFFLNSSGELQCSRSFGSYCIWWCRSLDDREPHATGSVISYDRSDPAMGSERRTKHKLSQLWTDIGSIALLWYARMSALGRLGSGQPNKGSN